MKDLFKKIIIKILVWQAKFLIKRSHPTIIAITGNLGKTSTKDFINAAIRKSLLSPQGDSLVLASKKSMNSEFGVPLTILGLQTGWSSPWAWLKIIGNGFIRIFDKFEYKYFVLEIGADAPGDIKNICRYIKPDIVVLTAFAKVPVHIEFFDNNRENLIREKKYLVENLKPGGTFIYNLDDEDCVKIAEEFSGKDIEFKTFSLKNKDADAYISNVETEFQEPNRFVKKIRGSSAKIKLADGQEKEVYLEGVVGQAIFYTLLPAILIGEILKLDLEKTIKDIEHTPRSKGRMRVLNGAYNSTIIDDTYNSSPKALENGIEFIKNLKIGGKKILVLGDMLELGDFTRQEHENVGKALVGVADALIVSGIRAKMIADSTADHGMDRENIFITNNSVEAGREALLVLEKEIENDYKEGKSEKEIGGDLVFVKGSQGARMEKAVLMIIDKSLHDSSEELVRQEKSWRSR